MLTPEIWLKYVLPAMAIVVGAPLAYVFGQRQQLRVQREKNQFEAANQRITAEAADRTSEAAILTAAIQGSNAAMKALIEGTAQYQALVAEVQKYSGQVLEMRESHGLSLMEMRANHAREMDSIRSLHQTEMELLRGEMATLQENMRALRRESEGKDARLSEQNRIHQRLEDSEEANAVLKDEVSTLRRGTTGLLYLWRSRMKENKGGSSDSDGVTLAEQAVWNAIRGITENEWQAMEPPTQEMLTQSLSSIASAESNVFFQRGRGPVDTAQSTTPITNS